MCNTASWLFNTLLSDCLLLLTVGVNSNYGRRYVKVCNTVCLSVTHLSDRFESRWKNRVDVDQSLSFFGWVSWYEVSTWKLISGNNGDERIDVINFEDILQHLREDHSYKHTHALTHRLTNGPARTHTCTHTHTHARTPTHIQLHAFLLSFYHPHSHTFSTKRSVLDTISLYLSQSASIMSRCLASASNVD